MSLSRVLGAEAYVLFYTKAFSEISSQKVRSLRQEVMVSSYSLLKKSRLSNLHDLLIFLLFFAAHAHSIKHGEPYRQESKHQTSEWVNK